MLECPSTLSLYAGLKIRRGEISVPVQVRSRAPIIKQLERNLDFKNLRSAPQKSSCSAKIILSLVLGLNCAYILRSI